MKRRGVLKCVPATAGSAAAGFGSLLANAQNYLAKLFVFLQADGGWDPTSFCDPKEHIGRAGHQLLGPGPASGGSNGDQPRRQVFGGRWSGDGAVPKTGDRGVQGVVFAYLETR